MILREENPKNGDHESETARALLVTLLAQVVMLNVSPDSLGHLRG